MNAAVTLSEGKAVRQKWVWMGLFSLVCFAGMFIFFTAAHPLYAYDLDDWLYVTYGRHALPDVAEWNPAKVLPETLMPLVSYFAAYVLYPLNGDYVQSLCYAFAGTTAFFVTGYVLAAAWIVHKRFGTKDGVLALLSSIFLLAHFLPFLVWDMNNVHLFHAGNVTCIFNYTIPALWNFILAAYFLTVEEKSWSDNSRLMPKALLVLAVYLAIHSNLLNNIILMSVFGIQLLFALVADIAERRKAGQKWIDFIYIKRYIGTHFPKLAGLVVWFVSMIFEISGDRALATGTGLNLYGSVRRFLESLLDMNGIFVLSAIVINLAALAVAWNRYRKHGETKFLYWQLEAAACMCLSVVYLILVTAKVNADYMSRQDVMISWMVFLMLMSVSSFAYLCKEIPKAILVLPLLLYLLFFETVTSQKTFADPIVSDGESSTVKMIVDDMIQQVKAAESQGLGHVEVHVPASEADGWPLDVAMTSHRFGNAMYYHNIVDHQISITIVPDLQKDAQFYLN